MKKRGKVWIRTDNIKPEDLELICQGWSFNNTLRLAELANCLLIPVYKEAYNAETSTAKEAKEKEET